MESGKKKAMSGSAVHSIHNFVRQNGAALGVHLTQKQNAILQKNVDALTPQDWIVLDAIGHMPEVNQAADVIYKKKRDRLEYLVSPNNQGKLLDPDEALFSTRAGQPGIFAMDRYGNLFIEPPTFNAGTDYFNPPLTAGMK